jgi:hypothetical protein
MSIDELTRQNALADEPAGENETSPVTERALVARINRALAKQYKKLRRCRKDAQGFSDLGAYYLLDGNTVIDTHVNIEALGRKLNVLGDRETLQAK